MFVEYKLSRVSVLGLLQRRLGNPAEWLPALTKHLLPVPAELSVS